MGKKRKYENMDDEKILRKIRKLQDKLKEKQNQQIQEKTPSKYSFRIHAQLDLYFLNA